MKNKHYTLLFASIIISIFFGVNLANASTLNVSGWANSACNASNGTSFSITEDRSFYITNAWIGGNGVWDDQIGFSGTFNGNVVVNTSAGWSGGCSGDAQAGSGYTDFYPLSMTGSTDNDTFTFSLLALQKRDEISSSNTFHGSIEYSYTKNLCSPGQYTLNNGCVWDTGTISVSAGGTTVTSSNASPGGSVSCTAPCSPVISWNVTSGLPSSGQVRKNNAVWNSGNNSGNVTDSGLGVGTYSYDLYIQDGHGDYQGIQGPTVTVADVPIVPTPTATMSVLVTKFDLTPTKKSDTATVKNESATSGGSFGVICTVPTAFPGLTSSSIDCPDSESFTANSSKSFSVTLDSNTPTTPGTYTGVMRIKATGENGTIVSGDSKDIAISYVVPTVVTPVPTCSADPTTVLVGQNTTLTGRSGDGSNYSWSASGGNFSSTSGKTVTVNFGSTGQKNISVTSGGSTGACAVTVSATPVMSGTLTPSSTSCEIYSGASTCNVTLTWSTTNPEATSAVTAAASPYAPAVNVSGNSGSQSFAVPYSSRTFYLYNNAKSLVPTSPNGTGVTVTSSCVAGTTWTSGACITTTAPPSPTCPSGQTGTPPNCTTPPTSGSVTLTANPNSGPAPLNGVSLRAAVGDSAGWKYYYYFFCNAPNPVAVPPGGSNPPFNNDGGSVTYTSSTTANSSNNCNYSSAGTYTGRVAVLKYQGSDPFTTNYWQNSSNWRQATAAVTATTPVSPITVSLTANPPSMTLPTNSTILTWTTTGNPTSCIASNGWSGAKTASGGTENRTGLTAQTYTYNITCSKSGVPDVIDTATVVVTAPVMSGTLAPTNPPGLSSCIIASGASACNINFSWTTTNPVSTSSVTRNPSSGFNPPLQNSGTNVPFPVPYNTATFFLYNNNTELAQSAVTASCVSGTTWDGSKCAVPLPAAPSNLQASNAICGAIRLTWQDNSNNETGFRIYRSRSQSFSIGGYYATVGANVTSYTDPTPMQFSSNYYMIASYNGVGENYSNAVSITPTGCMSGWLDPSVSCTISAGQNSCNANLSWNINNPESTPTAITASGMTNINVSNSLSTPQSGTQAVSVPYNSRTFYLYNNSKPLATSAATADCANNTTWTDGKCLLNSYTVTATAGPGGSISLAPSSLNTNTISSCGEIKTPGNYTLDRNISSSGTMCLNVHDVSNVHLNCNNYSITGSNVYSGMATVYFKNVNNFSLESCTIVAGGGSPVYIGNSTQGTIRKNTVGKYAMQVFNSSDLTIKNNTFDASYSQYYTNGSIIENNSFSVVIGPSSLGRSSYPGVVVSAGGFNNRIVNNNIDGKARGVLSEEIGADDGIVLDDERDDFVQNNIIKNNWDCGIETVGFIRNTIMSGNTISNSGLCGIGAWYRNSWKGNIISDNIISDAPNMFYFFRVFGLQPNETYVYFVDNAFSGNKFLNPRISSSALFNFSFFDYRNSGKTINPENLVLGNNRFSNNDFGVTNMNPPQFYPASMIVDGGGNRCSSINSFGNPLACSGSVAFSPTPTSISALAISSIFSPTPALAASVSSSTSQKVNYGDKATFTVTPDTGYSTYSITGCNGLLFGATYTTEPITGDCAVSATFNINKYTVTTSAGPGGSISPASRS
ncbi:MAG: Cell wall surface anchor family protein, partial [Parcubacteria group bacterium GW2011_GWC1_40_11]